MNYQQAVDYIHGIGRFGSKPGLSRIRELLNFLGNPQDDLKFIHVAGTNGKGSTSAYIAGMLQEANYKVGLFISPFIEHFNERIQINRTNIPEDDLAVLVTHIKDHSKKMADMDCGHPTQFEIITAVGLKYFRDQNVDLVVLEVGLGGRYDSTNIIKKPEVAVITTIGFDHQAILGDTLAKIAYEKAGIIKKGTPVVTGVKSNEALEVIRNCCKDNEAQLYELNKDFNWSSRRYELNNQKFHYKNILSLNGDFNITLNGKHQVNNASVALMVISLLNENGYIITKNDAKAGLQKVKWPGRLEQIDNNPIVLLDGAHNTHGSKALKEAILELKGNKKVIAVIGILKDKDYEQMLEDIASFTDTIIVTAPDYYRSTSVDELADVARNYFKHVSVKKPVSDALNLALNEATEQDIVLVTGSLYTIGEARAYLTLK